MDGKWSTLFAIIKKDDGRTDHYIKGNKHGKRKSNIYP